MKHPATEIRAAGRCGSCRGLVWTLVRAALLWAATRFYAVPSGQVSPEMAAVLETRLAVLGAAGWFERAILAGWWLGALLLVWSVRMSVPARRQWADIGLLAGGCCWLPFRGTWQTLCLDFGTTAT